MNSPRREQPSKTSQATDRPSNVNRRQGYDESKPKPSRLHLPQLTRSHSLLRFSNKLYRTPRTPPPEVQFDREQSFVLDCNAVSNISIDNSTANPKLGSAIPPYDSQLDHHVQSYFQFFSVPKTLEKSGQVSENNISSIEFNFVFYLVLLS